VANRSGGSHAFEGRKGSRLPPVIHLQESFSMLPTFQPVRLTRGWSMNFLKVLYFTEIVTPTFPWTAAWPPPANSIRDHGKNW
jgi:hypothetical protein